MNFLKRLYYYYFIVAFVLTFPFFFPFVYYYLQKPERYPKAHAVRRAWASLILFLWGVRVEVHNRKAIQWNRTYIFVSNHASYLDILCLLKVIPNFTGFLAKAELSDIPLFGIFFKTIDIEVHRGKGEMSASSYRKAVKALHGRKSLVIFPEGGIFPDPTKVKPFKEGAFQMAVRNKIPVVPISLPDNYKILPDRDERKAAKPGKIRVILYEPLDTGSMTEADLPDMCKQVHDLIQADITKYARK